MCYKLKEETAKLIMIFWCLFTFITAGFEHSVANMGFLTMGLLLPHDAAVTIGGWFHNVAWVSLGNFIGGVLFVKIINIFKNEKINPMIGAAGISAFPMSARVVQKLATKEDPQNFILMYSVSANVSGQIASVIAGGLILGLLS